MCVAGPQSEPDLLERANRLAGRTLGELAEAHGWAVPDDFRRAKGWVGRLIEQCLGASAGNRPVPDFEAIGVELKTLPISADGRPKETTYVCRVPFDDVETLTWKTSRVYKKLARVLWVPVAAADGLAIAARPVGQPLLWSPVGPLGEAIKRDWQAHNDAIRRGFIDEVSAKDGHVLQIRPKAANSDQLTWAPGRDGGSVLTLPRGYYLRRQLTLEILERHFGR